MDVFERSGLVMEIYTYKIKLVARDTTKINVFRYKERSYIVTTRYLKTGLEGMINPRIHVMSAHSMSFYFSGKPAFQRKPDPVLYHPAACLCSGLLY